MPTVVTSNFPASQSSFASMTKPELAFLGPKGTYSHQVSDSPPMAIEFVRSELDGWNRSFLCDDPSCVYLLFSFCAYPRDRRLTNVSARLCNMLGKLPLPVSIGMVHFSNPWRTTHRKSLRSAVASQFPSGFRHVLRPRPPPLTRRVRICAFWGMSCRAPPSGELYPRNRDRDIRYPQTTGLREKALR